ncbi:hypothetical protein EV421DRAFT_2022425 [Armillaria borealis]|uniref:Uncharacterized protein n=1 Tax=Armillaria borealis TaxID=47425 RepID=A0AA39J7E2_9AGAR|nr:hypothetical protein EV421DRAFT_2022425 [Armillaria borealis]
MRTGPCEALPTRTDFHRVSPSLGAISLYSLDSQELQRYSDPPSRDEPRDLSEAPKTHRGKGSLSSNYDQDTFSEVLAPTGEIWQAGVVYTRHARVHVPSRRLEQRGGCFLLAVLKSFGYATEQLNGTNVHSLPIPPRPLRNPIHLSLPPDITFTTPDNENLPVPSEPARYLCQGRPVFRGVDKQHRVVEDLGVLAEDGSSAETSKLFPIAIVVSDSTRRTPSSGPVLISSVLRLAFSSAVIDPPAILLHERHDGLKARQGGEGEKLWKERVQRK